MKELTDIHLTHIWQNESGELMVMKLVKSTVDDKYELSIRENGSNTYENVETNEKLIPLLKMFARLAANV